MCRVIRQLKWHFTVYFLHFFLGMCQNGICMNTIGSFHCECYPGYVYDEASHQCIDKNECLEDNPCTGTVIQNQ